MNLRNLSDVENSCLGEPAKEQLRKAFNETSIKNRTADTTSYMEQSFICKPLGTKKNPRFNFPVCIVVRSTRIRETDNRAISEKALVDGIVKAGILANDTKKEIIDIDVKEPEISKDEKTIIEIYEP